MKLHYNKTGNGPALVILHGLLGSGDNWMTLAKKWSENFTVYMVDQRNHGQSAHSQDFSFDLMAEDLAELINDEGIEQFDLIGHSMGGKTAMTFANKYPSLIRKMIIVDIGPKAYPPHHNSIFEGLRSVDFSVQKSRKAVESALSNHIPQIGVRQFLMKNLYWKVKGEELAWRFNLPVLYDKYEEVIGSLQADEISLPTLFIRGELSGYIQDKDAEKLKQQFPNSELITINGAGHWVHAEKPKEFDEAVSDFLLN